MRGMAGNGKIFCGAYRANSRLVTPGLALLLCLVEIVEEMLGWTINAGENRKSTP
jgi:hypothetical protein